MLRALDLTGYLDAIAAAEDVTVGKPDPQIFLTAAAKLAVPPSRCVVVEDAAAGVEGARRAAMKCIGVAKNGPLKADVVVTSLADLEPDAFDQLLVRGSPA